jgi:josephin
LFTMATARPPVAPLAALYHERQSLQRCAVHATNNLLQRAVYKPSDFDRICDELKTQTHMRHRSFWGTGNYDVNAVEMALSRADEACVLRWHDRRRAAIELPNADGLIGVLCNRRSEHLFGLIQSRHWIALHLRADDGSWWDLDSKLVAPERVPDIEARLVHELHAHAAELLFVERATPAPPSVHRDKAS